MDDSIIAVSTNDNIIACANDVIILSTSLQSGNIIIDILCLHLGGKPLF